MQKVSSLIALGVFAAPSLALAAGLYVPDTGTTARARGGAFCVAADDPLAMYYNPAGLADQHQKNQLLIDITALQLSLKFDRRASDIPADSIYGASSTNKPPVQIVPDIVFIHSFSEKFSFGGGLHAPTGARYHFATGSQRFTLNDLFLTEGNIGITAGYRPIKQLAIGATLETLTSGVHQKFTLTNNVHQPQSEAPVYDVPAKLDAEQMLNPTAVLGVKVTPVDSWEFGVAYRPAVHLNMPGKLSGGPISGKPIHFTSDLASILRIGGRFVRPTWDYELDLVREDWSVHKEDKVTADTGNLVTTKSSSVTRNWVPAYSVRGGSTFRLSEVVRGMAGWYYETSAVKKEYMDVGSFDAPKFGLNVGAKYDIGKTFTLSGNLSHTLMATQTVTNSRQLQQTGFTADPGALTTIGNGKYTGAFDFFGVQLLSKF